MSKIDIIIMAIVGVFSIVGCYRGLLGTAFSLVQYVAVIYFGILLTPVFSQFLINFAKIDLLIINWINSNPNVVGNISNFMNKEVLASVVNRIINVIAMILLFILLKLLFSIIFSVLNKFSKLPIINEVNRLGGIVIGLIEGLVIVYLIMLIINWAPMSALDSTKVELADSRLGNAINSYVPDVTDEIFAYVGEFNMDLWKGSSTKEGEKDAN